MYSNNIVNFQESTTILNACKKKNLETYWKYYVDGTLAWTTTLGQSDQLGNGNEGVFHTQSSRTGAKSSDAV